MAQGIKKKTVRRPRRPPPARRPVRRARRGPLPASRQRRVPWWAIALVALGCAGVVWLVVTSGGDATSGPDAPGTIDYGDVEPGDPTPDGSSTSGSIASRFPAPAAGERVELRVLSLGDDPTRCEAVSLDVGGERRTVYHHRCLRFSTNGDVYFFLVELRGVGNRPVVVTLDAFELVTADGDRLQPLDLQDVDRRFPASTGLAPGVRRKGWVLFDGSGAVPAELRYLDGDEELAVRFPDTWR